MVNEVLGQPQHFSIKRYTMKGASRVSASFARFASHSAGRSGGGGRSAGGGGGGKAGGGRVGGIIGGRVGGHKTGGSGHSGRPIPGRSVVVQPGRSKNNPVTMSDVRRAQRCGSGLNAKPVMQIPKHTPVPANVKQAAAQANVQISRKGGNPNLGNHSQVPGRSVHVQPGRSKHNPVTSSDVATAERYGRGLNARSVVQVPKYTPVPASVKQEAVQAQLQIKKD